MKRAILILGFLLMAGNAWAGSGDSLLTLCRKGPTKDYYQGFCEGYINGIMQSYVGTKKLIAMRSGNEPDIPCINPPSNTSPQQTRLIVMKYLKENPERLHFPSYDLIILALVQAWPCVKNN
jgi:Ssp1 endopeptidase immunity protein Rap1a